MRFLLLVLLACAVASAALIKDVRDAIAAEQFSKGEALIQLHRASQGVTPEMLEAMSWLGRGALKLKQLDKAETYARQTQDLVLAQLKKQPLDAEGHLPIALGAAIEVHRELGQQHGGHDPELTVGQVDEPVGPVHEHDADGHQTDGEPREQTENERRQPAPP